MVDSKRSVLARCISSSCLNVANSSAANRFSLAITASRTSMPFSISKRFSRANLRAFCKSAFCIARSMPSSRWRIIIAFSAFSSAVISLTLSAICLPKSTVKSIAVFNPATRPLLISIAVLATFAPVSSTPVITSRMLAPAPLAASANASLSSVNAAFTASPKNPNTSIAEARRTTS